MAGGRRVVARSRDASERQKITAPIDGEVVGLRIFNAGSVIGPREVLMEAWPTEDFQLVTSHVETSIPEDDLFAGLR